ncbi:uncharacterized protein LOC127278740 [Leptopilina boulardi]|uniref:uncharacterized protein LOC127278740 n=1 Tax=Leptopilina boulardi TaxID=63433 RepID=UPI0021F595A5|nr:uncharacterized protein LOC127278740 [Leptopilina boulardi]
MRTVVFLFFICNIFYFSKSYPQQYSDDDNFSQFISIGHLGQLVYSDKLVAANKCTKKSEYIECVRLANFNLDIIFKECLNECVTQISEDPDQYVCKIDADRRICEPV